jgi:hypothetical protein
MLLSGKNSIVFSLAISTAVRSALVPLGGSCVSEAASLVKSPKGTPGEALLRGGFVHEALPFGPSQLHNGCSSALQLSGAVITRHSAPGTYFNLIGSLDTVYAYKCVYTTIAEEFRPRQTKSVFERI